MATAQLRQISCDVAIARMDERSYLLDARNLKLYGMTNADFQRLSSLPESQSRQAEGADAAGARKAIAEIVGDAVTGADGCDAFLAKERERYYADGYSLRHLTLNAAHECNLRCAYCYAGHGRFKGKAAEPLMSREVAIRSVDYLLRSRTNTRDKIFIDFFGGEPLLNFDVIRETVLHVSRSWPHLGPRIAFSVSTNGYFMTDEIFDFLRCHNVSVYVSIDGDRLSHDRHRKTAQGAGSYDRIADNMRTYLPAAPLLFSARATVTPQTVDFCGVFDHLESLGFKEYGFDIAFGNVDDSSTSWDAASLARYDASFGTYVGALCGRILDGRDRVVNFVADALQRIHDRDLHVVTCRMAAYLTVVTPTGGLFPCYKLTEEEGLEIGNVTSGLDHQRRRSLYPKLVNERAGCRECWARYLCGGGCPAESILAGGESEITNLWVCESRKTLWKWMLWLYTTLRTQGFPIQRLFQR